MRHIRKDSSTTRALDAYRRRVSASATVVTALVLVIATSGIAVAASVAWHSPDRRAGRTIYLHTTYVSSAVNSAGNGGAGDVVATVLHFTTRDGQSGHGAGSCTALPDGEDFCHAEFVFPNGTIDAMVAIPKDATTWVAAIIGGTGIYDGARGQAVNVSKGPGVTDRVIHLLPDDH